MKKISIIIVIVLAVLAIFWATRPVSQEKSLKIATEWIKTSSPTYVFDGSNLQEKNTIKDDIGSCKDCFVHVFTFDTTSSGYGNRSGTTTNSVITPHIMVVKTNSGDVIEAITDGYFDELNNRQI